MAGMAGMAGAPEPELPAGDLAPLVYGLYDGGDLYFVHTESSDPDVAQMLTEMMGPEVIVVPELASAPEDLVGRVFVFTNGVTGPGPFGFQPDVFDSIPGEAAYRPLRSVHLVTWSDAASPERLSSADAVEARLDAGDITIEDSGTVVNMPVLIWPGGHR